MTRPRLFWAVTHQTLAKSDVPCLEAVGFEVVAEDPEVSVIRDSDILEYPAVGEQGVEWDAFRGMRLWARNGIVSPAEAEAVNSAFDAIMVHTRLDVARNVRSWFDGTVFFRHFGEMPWVEGDPDVADSAIDHAGIMYVPLLPSLVGTPLSRTFDATHLLRSILPVVEAQGQSPVVTAPERARIGMFVEKIGDPRKIRAWATKLAVELPDFEVVIMGLEPHFRDAVDGLPANVMILPRLEFDEYWALFCSLSALIYPYSNPRHIHYVPYEAIALGIPCLTSENAQVGIDLRTILGGAHDRGVGVFPTPEDVVEQAPGVVRNPESMRAVAIAQRSVLELMADVAVIGQARSLYDNAITRARFAARGAKCAADIVRPDITMPRNVLQRESTLSAGDVPMMIKPAAVVTSEVLGRGVHGVFDAGPCNRGELRVGLLPGEAHFIRVGIPASSSAGDLYLRVTVSVDHSRTFPAELTTLGGTASSWAPFIRIDGDDWSSASNWRAVANVGNRESLRIKVFGDSISTPIWIHGIQVEAIGEAVWWQERERHLVEVIEGLQVDYQELGRHAEKLEAECADLRRAAEEAGEWGAELERQLLARSGSSGERARRRIRGLLS